MGRPDNNPHETVTDFSDVSQAADVDVTAQTIKRALVDMRKQLFRQYNLDERDWSHTIRICPKIKQDQAESGSCGCGRS